MFSSLISPNLELRFFKNFLVWEGEDCSNIEKESHNKAYNYLSAMGKIILSKDDKSTAKRTMLIRYGLSQKSKLLDLCRNFWKCEGHRLVDF